MGEAQVHHEESEHRILKEAEELASKSEWRKAALLIGSAGSTIPLSSKAQGAQAFYYSRAGDHEKAITLFTDLCRLEPKEARWPFYLGFQFQQKEQWVNAIASYEEAFKRSQKWIKIHLSLGQAYEKAGQYDKALNTYREARRVYKELSHESRLRVVTAYGTLCKQAAKLLLSKESRQSKEVAEALNYLYEGTETTPDDFNSWYRLGNLLLDLGRLDEALQHLSKAEMLAPRNEYVCHKIAQIHFKKGNPDEALRRYNTIQPHKQMPYILRGIAQCFLAKGQALEAAKKLHQAIRREPDKFYHHWDFALALIELKARDQAIEALEKTNNLYEREHGKRHKQAIAKLAEVRSALAPSDRINFEPTQTAVSSISFGTVSKFNAARGFGFIRDRSDSATIFFHISHVKNRITPQTGTTVKFVREIGGKGPQASHVWILEG